jgi:uncharacterized tellurite resistance protein B-like protein
MGIFDKLFSTTSSTLTYVPQSEQEAWIAIMYACMEADGYVSEPEVKKMFELVAKQQPLFKNVHVADYYQPAMLAHKKVGGKVLIDSSTEMIESYNKPVLFKAIMELLLADGILTETEKEIATYLTTTLPVELGEAKRIVDSILVRK